MSRPRGPLAIAVLGVAVAFAGLAAWLIAQELPDFWDPCMGWGEAGDSGPIIVSPDDECPTRSGTSETKLQAAGRLAAVDGSTIVASVLAGVAAWRRLAWPAAVAAVLMTGVTVLLFFGLSIAFPLTLAVAVLYAVAAGRWRRPAPATVPEGS